MLTRTSEYALRAMIHLSQNPNEGFIPGGRIAAQTGVPRKYLSKILGDLVRAGVLEAAPGKSGGFRMTRSPKKVRLFEVLAPFEPVLANRRPCPFGNETCSDEDPCAGHDRWKRVRDAYRRFLDKTSVYDVAAKHNGGHKTKTSKRKKR